MPSLIRLATEDDAPAIAAIYAPYVRDTAISFELEPPDAGAFRTKIRDVLKLAPWLVREDDGIVVGYAYASSFRARRAYRFTVETSVYVRGDMRGRGVGRSLYEELMRTARGPGLQARDRGHDGAERPERGAPCSARIRARRHVPRGRVQVRPVARRRVLGAPARARSRTRRGSRCRWTTGNIADLFPQRRRYRFRSLAR